MADPISGAAIGGAANAVGSKVIEKIVQGEDDHSEWIQQVTETATKAEAARRNFIESAFTEQRRELEHVMEQIGLEAQKLEVIGERQGYPDGEVDEIGDLAEICSRYASVTKANNLEPEERLSDELPPVVENIFSFAGR